MEENGILHFENLIAPDSPERQPLFPKLFQSPRNFPQIIQNHFLLSLKKFVHNSSIYLHKKIRSHTFDPWKCKNRFEIRNSINVSQMKWDKNSEIPTTERILYPILMFQLAAWLTCADDELKNTTVCNLTSIVFYCVRWTIIIGGCDTMVDSMGRARDTAMYTRSTGSRKGCSV